MNTPALILLLILIVALVTGSWLPMIGFFLYLRYLAKKTNYLREFEQYLDEESKDM